jgi:hypothetical protein
MKRALGVLAVLLPLLVAAGAGCGDDDTPSDKCNDLFGAVCRGMSGCSYIDYATCRQEIAGTVDCGRVCAVTANYDPCMGAIGAMTCDQLNPGAFVLPAVCQGVLLTGCD